MEEMREGVKVQLEKRGLPVNEKRHAELIIVGSLEKGTHLKKGAEDTKSIKHIERVWRRASDCKWRNV